MLPDGLIDLIKKVLKEDPMQARSLDKSDLWKDFTWGIFLDGIRINAEVSYIRDTLWNANLLDKDWISNHTQQQWEIKVEKFLSKKIKSLGGRKRGALSGLRSDLSTPAKSLKESARFFKIKNVSPKLLNNETVNRKTTDGFLRDMSYQPVSSNITGRFNPDKIFNIGLVKALLWLQGYGLTKEYCPPSRQIKDFVDNDIKNLTWMQRKFQIVSNDWYYVTHMRNFNDKEIKPRLPSATVRDTGLAIWYWKIVQGLLKRTDFKGSFTPEKLLSYLKMKKINLDGLIDLIDDIDEVDNLASDVKVFLKANP